MKIVTRPYAEADRLRLESAGVHPLLARLYAARRISSAAQLEQDFAQLLPPAALANADRAARLLADAIAQRKKLLIIADYDADGATACAVGVRALRALGAKRRLPRAQPHGARLRPDARAGGHRRRGEFGARPADHRGQRHRQRRGRRAREAPRHRHAGHRPPPAGRHAARRRVHREPEPARLRLSVESDRRRRRDVLCHAGAQGGIEESKGIRRQNRTQPRCPHRPGRARHHRRRGAAGREQPDPRRRRG